MTTLAEDATRATPEPAGGGRPAKQTERKARMTGGRWVLWLVLVLGGVVMMFPVYWVLVTAVSPGGLAQDTGFSLWPDNVQLGIFADAVDEQPM